MDILSVLLFSCPLHIIGLQAPNCIVFPLLGLASFSHYNIIYIIRQNVFFPSTTHTLTYMLHIYVIFVYTHMYICTLASFSTYILLWLTGLCAPNIKGVQITLAFSFTTESTSFLCNYELSSMARWSNASSIYSCRIWCASHSS